MATSTGVPSPWGVFIDIYDNVFIAVAAAGRICKVDAITKIITSIAGTDIPGYSGDNGSASSAQLNNAYGIWGDSIGNLFIADEGNYRVRKISAGNNIITTIAGNGIGGYSGDNGLATNARITEVKVIWGDTNGNLFLPDYSKHCIRKINGVTNIITTIAGTGVPGTDGNNGPATSAQLYYVNAIWGDTNGNIFIIEYGNSIIRRIDVATPHAQYRILFSILIGCGWRLFKMKYFFVNINVASIR